MLRAALDVSWKKHLITIYLPSLTLAENEGMDLLDIVGGAWTNFQVTNYFGYPVTVTL